MEGDNVDEKEIYPADRQKLINYSKNLIKKPSADELVRPQRSANTHREYMGVGSLVRIHGPGQNIEAVLSYPPEIFDILIPKTFSDVMAHR